MIKKNYVAPTKVVLDTSLTPFCRELFVEILQLQRVYGKCFALDFLLSSITHRSKNAVRQGVKSLVERGYLERQGNTHDRMLFASKHALQQDPSLDLPPLVRFREEILRSDSLTSTEKIIITIVSELSKLEDHGLKHLELPGKLFGLDEATAQRLMSSLRRRGFL